MKPVSKTASAALPALALDATDLHELHTLFSATCKGVTVSDGSFEYESVEELQQSHGARLSKFEIRGRTPYVSLAFNRSNAQASIFLYAEEGDDSAQALYVRLSALLLARRRWHVRLLPWPVTYVLMLAGLALSAFSVLISLGGRHEPRLVLGASVTALILWPLFLLGVLGQKGITYVIRPVTRKQRSQRWADFRDKIVLALLSALVGGILGAVIHAYSTR